MVNSLRYLLFLLIYVHVGNLLSVTISKNQLITNSKKNSIEYNDSCYKNNSCTDRNNSKYILSLSINKPFKKLSMSAFPQFFDAREKFGYKCPGIQQIYNQGQCKAGWAVTIASVISDQICINSNGRTLKMLSAQQLLSCCKECCGCNGGIIMKAWEWVLKNGLVTGSIYGDKKSCFPYKMPPARPSKYGSSGHGGEWATVNSALPECPGTCMDGSQRSSNFSNTSYIINFEKCRVVRNYELWPRKDQFGIMEALMTHGPLQVSMHLYEDFRYYTNGIYVHKTGVFEGDHAAKLIGWGTWKSKDYWLLMNSFGNTSWGMKGTFWIPRDGTDNVEFGYAIIGPIFTSIAPCTHITVIQLVELLIFYFQLYV